MWRSAPNALRAACSLDMRPSTRVMVTLHMGMVATPHGPLKRGLYVADRDAQGIILRKQHFTNKYKQVIQAAPAGMTFLELATVTAA